MELSKRLEMLAGMVSEGNRLVDVGTDHGLVPIFLVKQGKIPSAIAADVKYGPLSRARKHIAAYGLTDYIEARLSDGLKNIRSGEGDTLLLAGMGGNLMIRILAGGTEALFSFRELVLQPQSVIVLVRKALSAMGFRVVEEAMVFEEGKYYPMMRLVPGEDCYEREIEFYYGRLLLKEQNPVLERYLRKQQAVLYDLKKQLSKQAALPDAAKGGAVAKRLLEIEEELGRLEEALESYR